MCSTGLMQHPARLHPAAVAHLLLQGACVTTVQLPETPLAALISRQMRGHTILDWHSKRPKKKKKKNLKSLFPPSFVSQLRVCGREGRVCALRTNELKFRAPSAGGRHSGLVTEVWRWRRSGGDAEGSRRLEGRRASGVTRCVCVSGRRLAEERGGFFPFFFFFGGGVSIRYSLLPLSPPFNRPLTPFPNPAGSCFAGRSARSRETGAAV